MKGAIWIRWGACLVCLFSLAACGGQKSAISPSSDKLERGSQSSDRQVDREETVDVSGLQQIGTEEVGYVYVPKDWGSFYDIGTGGLGYQYSDKSTYNIITMASYSKEDLGVDSVDQATVERVASNYYGGLEEAGNFIDITGAMSEVAGYEAYQIYCQSISDGKLFCAWLFTTEERDRVYLLSLEGDEATFREEVPVIEATWSVNAAGANI